MPTKQHRTCMLYFDCWCKKANMSKRKILCHRSVKVQNEAKKIRNAQKLLSRKLPVNWIVSDFLFSFRLCKLMKFFIIFFSFSFSEKQKRQQWTCLCLSIEQFLQFVVFNTRMTSMRTYSIVYILICIFMCRLLTESAILISKFIYFIAKLKALNTEHSNQWPVARPLDEHTMTESKEGEKIYNT